MSKESDSYKADDITILEGLEAVRKRPGMYIGTTGTDGLHHLLTEVFENSRDEAMGGFASEIEVVFLPDSIIRVSDNGRGIPVDIHKKTKVSALETIMTTLHAGGKFGGKGYKVSGGLHGVGISVVNALSKKVNVFVHRDGDVYTQEYIYGNAAERVKKIEKTKAVGTVVMFRADDKILDSVKYDFDRVIKQLRQQAYLINKTLIRVIDAREDNNFKLDTSDLFVKEYISDSHSFSFYFESGLKALIRFYNQNQEAIHHSIFYIHKKNGDIDVEIAIQYVNDVNPRIVAFANNTYNSEGGTHVTGFKLALTRTINAYIKANPKMKISESFIGDDVLEGLTAVISIKMPELQFEGQTKSKLGSISARGVVEQVLSEALLQFLEENPLESKLIISRISLASQARIAAKAAKMSVLRKGALEGLTLPGKLTDCQSRDPSISELFIVEGESAGGTAKQGRDRHTQAILPLKGKILNVWQAKTDRVFTSQEIRAVSVALGCGVGNECNVDKLRYHKIVIATDADVDGAHIRTLLLTLFF